MEDNWQFIREFYARKGFFTCAQRGPGDELRDIQVDNVWYAPASEKEIASLEKKMSKRLTPSHKRFLSMTNGGFFFAQKIKAPINASGLMGRISLKILRIMGKDYESGFQLYSTNEMPCEYKWTYKLMKEVADETFDEDEDKEKQQYLRWLDNVLIIGEEPQSGNYLSIDYNRNGNSGEYPVIFINHEVPLSCSVIENDESVIACSIENLLVQAAKNPANFLMKVLGGLATYSDGNTDIDWYPKSYRTM